MEQRLKEHLKGKRYVEEEQKLINDNLKRPLDQKRGELEMLIDRAEARGLLSSEFAEEAHKIRKQGNDAVHRAEAVSSELAKVVLENVQQILTKLDRS